MMMSNNINDKRAQNAYEFIEEISKENAAKGEKEQLKQNKEFRSLARSFPTMVQNNGLCVAVAFLRTKSENAHEELYKKLGVWLKKPNLVSDIVNLNRDKYRQTSQEVMAYAQWVKRFAEGRWDKDGKEKK